MKLVCNVTSHAINRKRPNLAWTDEGPNRNAARESVSRVMGAPILTQGGDNTSQQWICQTHKPTTTFWHVFAETVATTEFAQGGEM